MRGLWASPTESMAGNPYDYDRQQPYGQLYNLREDLGEQRNLYTQQPARVKSMMQLLRTIRTGVHSP